MRLQGLQERLLAAAAIGEALATLVRETAELTKWLPKKELRRLEENRRFWCEFAEHQSDWIIAHLKRL